VPTVLQAKSEMKLPERSIYFEEKPETSFNNFIPVGSKQVSGQGKIIMIFNGSFPFIFRRVFWTLALNMNPTRG